MLNDRECKNAKRQEKPYKLPDGNGLYLEVKPNGVKAWRYRFELRQDGAAKEPSYEIRPKPRPAAAAARLQADGRTHVPKFSGPSPAPRAPGRPPRRRTKFSGVAARRR